MASQIISHGEVVGSVRAGNHTAEKISEDLVVSKSTVYRYAADLVRAGWLSTQVTARQKGRRRITAKAYVVTERGEEAYVNGEVFV